MGEIRQEPNLWNGRLHATAVAPSCHSNGSGARAGEPREKLSRHIAKKLLKRISNFSRWRAFLTAAIFVVGGQTARAQLTYTFTYSAASGPIQSFGFSLSAPTFITTGSPAFAPFTVTDGTRTWNFTQVLAGTSSNGIGCILFGTAGSIMDNACAGGFISSGPSPIGYLAVRFASGLPTALGTFTPCPSCAPQVGNMTEGAGWQGQFGFPPWTSFAESIGPSTGSFQVQISGASSSQVVNLNTACVNGNENGLQVDINGVASPGSSVTYIAWSWGDGAATTGFFPESHTYSSTGTYTVQVTAHYNNGSTASSSQSVTVASGLEPSNCEELTIKAGAGGSVIYQASIGSALVPPGSSATLYLAFADDLTLATIPGSGYSFYSWSPSPSGITGPGGAPVPTVAAPITVVVTGTSTIQANFGGGPSSTCSATPSPVPQTIPIIPGSGPNGFWTWTPAAPYEPFGVIPISPQTLITTGYPLIPGSYLVDVSGALWGLSASGGSLPSTVSADVTMAYGGAGGALNTSVGVGVSPNTSPIGSIFNGIGVVGYPNLTYGYSPQNVTITPESGSLPLPLAVSALPNVWSMINYSMGSLSAEPAGLNLAYDIWITKGCQQTPASDPPHGISKNDLELMIWPYRGGIDVPIALLPLGGIYTVPTWVNGSLVSATWRAYVGRGPANPQATVSFVLTSPAPAAQAYIGVNISAMVEKMIQALVGPVASTLLGSSWTTSALEGYYVNNISFGSEFVVLPNLSSATANHNYSYTISDFCFVVNSPTTSPSPTSWSSYACPSAP